MKDIGVYERLLSEGHEIKCIETKSESGKSLSKVNIEKVSKEYKSNSIGVHPHILHSILQQKIERDARIIFDFFLTEILYKKGKVVIVGSTLKEYEFDFIIGRDGLHSNLRKMILGESPYRDHSQFCWRGISSSV